MNKKKFLIDSILNIFSAVLPLLVLQLMSLPIAANKLGAADFGIMITGISILTVISFPVGNVLNNIRLLRHETYSEKNIKGDFNYILTGSSLTSALLLIFFSALDN